MTYESAMQVLGGATPTWINKEDGARIAAYNLYDAMYKNAPETFQLMLRGGGDIPVYMPSSKKIINTLARYIGKDFGFNVVPLSDAAAPEGTETADENPQTLEAVKWYGDFFKREELLSKFSAGKKEFLRHGDWFWYIYADPNKPEGSRVSIRTLDPGMVLPLWDKDDPDKVVGYDLVERLTKDDEALIKRQRYLKASHPEHANHNPDAPPLDAPIQLEILLIKEEGWEDPEEMEIFEVIRAAEVIPGITHLPIYHVKNNAESNQPFGASELSGLERAIIAINQAVNDEDIALAMAGLGMYASDGGAPTDDEGNEVDWDLGPGKVVEDASFKRINGVTTVEPTLKHMEFISQQLNEALGITPTVLGEVDTTAAESGIALHLRMSPTIDAAEEKNVDIKAKFDQILHDLKQWFAVYEAQNFDTVEILTVFGSIIPVNREKQLLELQTLMELGLISKAYFRVKLVEDFGYDLPDDIEKQIEDEKAAADPFGDRLGQEASGGGMFGGIDNEE